ncbi:MAG TPA: hypothetical protein VFS76_10675 [Pyrinomonadaceae bacterium]|nr:hypothetical protein [Pyrinomonadaceae bacterium]
MEITISHVEYQEPEKRILVTVSYGEQQPNGTWHRAKVAVFIDWADSYEEIKRQATEKAKAFLSQIVSDR